MAGGCVGGGNESCGSASDQALNAFFLSGSSPSFLGSRNMVSFKDAYGANGSKRLFFGSFNDEDGGVDELDEYFRQPDKKRRLTVDQVQFLEKCFEVESKLEPERKDQLAKDLGLLPRQVAIWFQNRRARWKTKQMEKDYDVLHASYASLKADYDDLLKEKEKLKAEIEVLVEKLFIREKVKEKANIESSGKDTLSREPLIKPISDSASEGEVSKLSMAACKQEDISSAKSDIFDSDSPRYTDGIRSSLLEAADSSYAFEPEQSDLSQDEEDNLSKTLLPTYFPKLEDDDYNDPPASFDDHAFWTWPY